HLTAARFLRVLAGSSGYPGYPEGNSRLRRLLTFMNKVQKDFIKRPAAYVSAPKKKITNLPLITKQPHGVQCGL
ncbi:hypothetical protein, partial [Providencia sp. PROV158]|uniref:hypothetical protein n=1 Tax=Providencia sp. PROV158 TaxID=2949868 RepID=UPI002349BD8A